MFDEIPMAIVQSEPLYLDTNGTGHGTSRDVLTFHYLVHCALDSVEEKRECGRVLMLNTSMHTRMHIVLHTEDSHSLQSQHRGRGSSRRVTCSWACCTPQKTFKCLGAWRH